MTEEGPLPPARACDYIRQAALGLQPRSAAWFTATSSRTT
jgi:hypothetical protein